MKEWKIVIRWFFLILLYPLVWMAIGHYLYYLFKWPLNYCYGIGAVLDLGITIYLILSLGYPWIMGEKE